MKMYFMFKSNKDKKSLEDLNNVRADMYECIVASPAVY